MDDEGGGGSPLLNMSQDDIRNIIIGNDESQSLGISKNSTQECATGTQIESRHTKNRFQRLYEEQDPLPYIVIVESDFQNVGKFSKKF